MGHLEIRPNQTPSMKWGTLGMRRLKCSDNSQRLKWHFPLPETLLVIGFVSQTAQKNKGTFFFLSMSVWPQETISYNQKGLFFSKCSAWKAKKKKKASSWFKSVEADANIQVKIDGEWNTRKSTGSCGWALQHSIRPWLSVGIMCSIRYSLIGPDWASSCSSSCFFTSSNFLV